jgi:prepilin-type processing-associated H-X9-DG protein
MIALLASPRPSPGADFCPAGDYNTLAEVSPSVGDDGPMLVTATSRHPGGVNVQMADGSGRFVRDSVDPKVWAAIGSIAGGEAISADY